MAIGGRDTGPGRLGQGRYQGIPLQVQPLQRLEVTESHGKTAQLVGVKIQVLEITELAKIFRQLRQLILGQVQFDQVGEEGEVVLQKETGKSN